MKLLTKELEKKFPPIGYNENKESKDIKIIAKFFDPIGSWTWYAIEYDPKDRIFYGYVKGLEDEFGNFSLSELEEVKGRFGLGIERDLYFGEHTLAEVLSGVVQ